MKRQKLLVACEYSGTVRRAFEKKGYDAWSCDLLPTEIKGKHYQGDIYDIFNDWSLIGGKPDIVIAHPVCTRRANSGVCWLKGNPERQAQLILDDKMFNDIIELDIAKICVENPIPHKYSKVPKYTQIIQPWQFGTMESKATCLWLKGLPKLIPTNNVKEEMLKLPKNISQRLHYLPPSKDRGHERSRTYQCFADVMADQWG